MKPKSFLFLIAFIFYPLLGFSTHIVGGCITYVFNGGSNYTVTFKLYRDCSAGTAPLPDTVIISVAGNNGAPFSPSRDIAIPLTTVTPVPSNLDSCTLPPNPMPCTEEGLYTTTVNNLPPNPGGYHLYFQLIARNWSLTNVNASGNNVGESFYAYIPGPPISWSEDFLLNNGTNVDTGPTAWTTSAGVTAPNSASVSNGSFQTTGANNAQQTWTSQVINIAAFPTGVDLSVDLSENGTLEANDSILVFYSLNGGPFLPFTVNGFIADDFGTATSTQVGLIGTTIQFVIQVHYDANSPNSEQYNFDNVQVGGTAFMPNSNPSFNLFPPLFLCVGDPFTFDHAASDADGDSLVYSFYQPFDGDNGIGPLDPTFPNNTATFQPVTFLSGFSTTNPLGGTPLNLNSSTGLLSGTPLALGQYVVGIRVKEYRNGVYLSTTYRDFQFNVINCPQFAPAQLNPITSCNGNTISFSNAGGGSGGGWLWNFGDNATLADTSNLNFPTYTYPLAGNYTVSLTTGVGTPCRNTATTQLVINSVIPKFGLTLPHCIGNSVSFTDSTLHSANVTLTSWLWNFGDGSSATLQNPTHTYLTAGTFTVTLTVSSNANCTGTVSKTITVSPTPIANAVASLSYCHGANTQVYNLSATPSGTTFTWTNSNASIGLAASGSSVVPSFSAVNTTSANLVANIIVIPNYNGCPGQPISFSITVKPIPQLTIPPNQIVCDGATVVGLNPISSPAGASINWVNSNTAIGLGISGSGAIPAFTANNAVLAAISGTISLTPTLNACIGAAVSYAISVKPRPSFTSPVSQVVCAGTSFSTQVFSSSPSGASFSWTNSNTAIGLAAAGNDSIPAFTTANAGAAVLVSNITVLPQLNGCFGNAGTFTLSVNPTPVFTAPANQTYCPGQSIAAFNFTSTPAGASFTWLNNNSTIGLAAGGIGSIPAFTTLNTGTTVLTASVTIALSLNSCPGSAQSFAITINPKPVNNSLSNQVLCSGEPTSSILFSSIPPGATFNWTNSSTIIGLTSAGTGNISSFVALNNLHSIISSTITVTPVLNGCSGNSSSMTINVNPLPEVLVPLSNSVCDGTLMSLLPFSSLPLGATYSWTNSNTSIGLAASGNGNIGSFTASNNLTTSNVGSITVTPQLNGCFGAPGLFSISVQPRSVVALPADVTVCAYQEIPYLSVSGTPAGTTFSWANTNSTIGLAASGTGDVPAFSAINKGGTTQTAFVTITPSFFGCEGNPATYKINVEASPVAEFTYTPNPATVLNSTIFFTETSLFAQTFLWDFGDGTTSFDNNPSHEYQDTGCYPVRLIAINVNGCRDTAYHLICINGDFAIYIPNAFTPDGDGINDGFFPKGVGILPEDYELQIFDRWGLLLFKSNNLEKSWDGRTSNLALTGEAQIDTYVYKIHCQDIRKKVHDFIGTVTLLR